MLFPKREFKEWGLSSYLVSRIGRDVTKAVAMEMEDGTCVSTSGAKDDDWKWPWDD